ncbi:MAG: 2-succinyl-5-enolpyruvyl-6-hydroxy-3-cyclohexene-1-carboxylate synthase [Aeromicrobium sp.]
MRATEQARELVNRLLAAGTTDVVVAPGSRSGPLARAAAAADAQRRLRLHVRVDEREAGFLALGLAKVTGRLTPVITTSGTAVANLHPALLEALHSSVPLFAVTADRPARLRGTGANQTTVQPGIFPGVLTLAGVDDIGPAFRGPAHLNIELDEPLTESVEWDFPASSDPFDGPPSDELTTLAPGPRTLVIAGDRSGRRARQAAEAAGWPLLAEPSSGSRTGPALSGGRLLLGHGSLVDEIERVVSFGHPTLSRAVTSLLARDIEIVHVGSQATFPVPAGPNVTFVEGVDVSGPDDPAWLQRWQTADAAVREAATDVLDALGPAADPLRVARDVWAAVPPEGLLVVGPSNPVRDLDIMAAPFPVGERRKVVSNRGLAGIDGVLSTAIGSALGRQSSRAFAYVGDLTFLHGSNGLMIGPDEPRPDLTIVVVNDDGGSIFAGLEQGGPEFADSFERVFGTPTGIDLGALCAAFGVAHRRVDVGALPRALAGPVAGLEVIEVPVPRDSRRYLSDALSEAVAIRLR